MYRRPWLPVPPANTDADVWGRSFHWSIRQQKAVWMMGFTLALLFIGADHIVTCRFITRTLFLNISIYIHRFFGNVAWDEAKEAIEGAKKEDPAKWGKAAFPIAI